MPESLPARPNLEQLKKRAKELQKAFNSEDPEIRKGVQEAHPELARISAQKLRLSDIQLLIARHYGFPSWTRLKERVEAIEAADVPMEALVRAVLSSDTSRARQVLNEHPELKPRLDEPVCEVGFKFGMFV